MTQPDLWTNRSEQYIIKNYDHFVQLQKKGKYQDCDTLAIVRLMCAGQIEYCGLKWPQKEPTC